MDAKTQDAAGVLVRNNERVHYQPDANPGDRWMVTRDGEPRLWAESLYVIAQHLNLDIEEFNRCAALMEPAAPTGEAYVPWDGHDYARDRESLEECVHDAAAKVRAGDHVDIWLPTLVAHAITFLDDATLLHASRAALLAARVPAPSAPQEPRGEPGEGMAALDAARVALAKVWHGARHTDAHHELLRDAFKSLEVVCAALSTGGRDAE